MASISNPTDKTILNNKEAQQMKSKLLKLKEQSIKIYLRELAADKDTDNSL